jgi:hypothetical protein
MKLLTVENAKTVKGEKLGYLTGILYLAPANESGVMNTCPMSTAGCRAGCLYTAGRAAMFAAIPAARIRKTRELFNDREGFVTKLRADITSLIKSAARQNLIPAIRINGTSDLPKLAMQLASEFPTVQFYDYTKIPRAWERTLPNYHITFSLSESNMVDAIAALQHGLNVAAVFPIKRGHDLPETFLGFGVIDGDAHDLRFLDKHRTGLIVGLRAKGQAKKDSSGFVQIAPVA